MTSNGTIAARIWEFIQTQGPRGAIADEALAKFPELGHTTVTARIHGLKSAGLIVRHPERIVRKTRKGRTAEVWIVKRGAKFDAAKYREPKKKDKEPKGDLHSRLTEIVDSAFGPIPTAPVEKLLCILEERAEEMRVERIKDNDEPESCDLPHVTQEEQDLLAVARAYGELGPHDEAKVEKAIDTLFDKIVKVYPVKKDSR